MRGILIKLTENKPLSAAVRITAVLIVKILLDFFILPFEFLRIDTSGFFDKIVNQETLSLSEWFFRSWNNDIRIVAINLAVIILLLVFGFRFRKTENLRLSRHTVLIALICLLVSTIGYSYMMYYDFTHGVFMWQDRISYLLRTIVTVAFMEEFIYRSLITNELFHLKPSGLNIPVAIVISAVIFGLIHIDTSIFNFLRYGFAPSIGTMEQFLYTVGCGISWAVILYYKKDIVSLVCMHTASNLLDYSYYISGRPMLIGALFVTFNVLFFVCYPVFLIFTARKKTGVLHSG